MHDIEVEFDVPVPLRDGTVLRADIYRPAGEGSYPVLVSRHPYGKNFLVDAFGLTRDLARGGYVVIHQDSRGRFGSEGEWLPWKYEREDGYDTIEWAAALPYSNGNVGTIGGSYLGSTQWSSAIAGPPHLKAIAPAVTWSDPADGLMFRGGAIEFGLNTSWGPGQALGQYAKTGLSPDEMAAKFMAAIADLDNIATDGFWGLPAGAPPIVTRTGQPDVGVARALADPTTLEESNVSSRYDEISVPSLNIAGWYDIFQQGSIDNYVAMRSRGRISRLIVGPWSHLDISQTLHNGVIGEVNFGAMSMMPLGKTFTQICQEWYDHWLKDEPATAAHEPGVLLFTMGRNEWRVEDDWPLARAKDTPLYLYSNAALNWAAPDSDDSSAGFTYDPADPVITRGGAMHLPGDFPAGPFDQRDIESREDVLVFTTEAFEEEVEISGRVRATLYASTDGPSTDWVVRLCVVDDKGVSRNVVDGIRRVETEPGRIDEVEVDLWSTSIAIPAGHRLRVHVSSSNFPRWDRNLNTGEPVTSGTAMRTAQQKVYFDQSRPSRIVLPLIP
jgi:putative CocE/NonD family hydrolase